MELILRDDVEKLGRRGDVVDVTDGYGRNYLLPRGLAMPVTEANKAMVEKEKKAWAARMAKEKAEYEVLAERISGLRFVAPRKVGENDVLYGSVTGHDVAEFLEGKGIEVDKRRVLLDEPIKHLGEHEVKIKLHPDVVATLKLLVTKEG
jgi:large subunit ribosomal protein L9